MSSFEKWRESIGECPGSLVSGWMEKGWDARGVEDAKPQSPETCPAGHPVWALIQREDAAAWGPVCSICAEVAKAETAMLLRIRAAIKDYPNAGLDTEIGKSIDTLVAKNVHQH